MRYLTPCKIRDIGHANIRVGAPDKLFFLDFKQALKGHLVAFKVAQKVALMSVVVFELGAFVVMGKHIFQKTGSDLWYVRRRIPEDIRKH